MFKRSIVKDLEQWLAKAGRKPLVIRGARQVGKTTVINQFALQFEQYIYVNLELYDDNKPFQQFCVGKSDNAFEPESICCTINIWSKAIMWDTGYVHIDWCLLA